MGNSRRLELLGIDFQGRQVLKWCHVLIFGSGCFNNEPYTQPIVCWPAETVRNGNLVRIGWDRHSRNEMQGAKWTLVCHDATIFKMRDLGRRDPRITRGGSVMTGQVDGKRNLSCTILLFRWLLRSGQKRYFWLYFKSLFFQLGCWVLHPITDYALAHR